MVVDDDPSLVATLNHLLTEEGYAVEAFTDPLAALARLRQARNGQVPDVVLSDCIMPGLTGGELVVALREAGIDVPVVLMTALSDPSFCVHPGEIRVINKPFDLDDLLAEIDARVGPRWSARRQPQRLGGGPTSSRVLPAA
jgi:two-component system response regulator MprA